MSTLRSLIEAGLGTASSFRQRLLILTYHRVLPEKDALLPDEPSVAEFRIQMATLARYFNVLPLAEAAERLGAGSLPARAVALTFDDGYRNNYEVAAPVLDDLGLPATIFVATAYLDGGCMWNDVVIESVRGAKGPELDLALLGLPRFALGTLDQRRLALDAILQSLKHRAFDERARLSMDLARFCGLSAPADLMMTCEQVAALARFNIAIGAHTVSHPILSRISTQDASAEISSSKHELETITGREVNQFAYPNGRPGTDYDETHVALAREAGFALAVSTIPSYADRDSDRFQLPRIGAHRASRTRFALNLLAAYTRSA